MTLLDHAGRELTVASRREVITAGDLRDRSGSDVFRMPLQTHSPYYSQEYFSRETGEAFMDASIPILSHQTDAVRGVLLATIRLKDIWSLITDIKLPGDGKAYVVNPRGRILVHSNPSFLLRGDTIRDSQMKNGIFKDLSGRFVLRAVENFHLGDQLLLMVVDQPLRQVFELTIQTVLIISILVVLALAGAMGLGLYAGRRIILPLEELAATAREIGRGDYHQTSPVRRHDEIGLVAEAFNRMAGKLTGTIDSLKKEMVERKKAYEEAAIMKERGRLARELHDSVTQSLYSVALFAESAKQQTRDGSYDELEDNLTILSLQVQAVLKELRLLIYDLRPSALKEGELLEAIQQRLDAVERRSGVKGKLFVSGDTTLAPRLEECIYRIEQEALNNALKHAAANCVEVRLTSDHRQVELRVSDDGIGFAGRNDTHSSTGVGIASMRERAASLGGNLTIDSTPGEGTTVSASFPIAPPEPAQEEM